MAIFIQQAFQLMLATAIRLLQSKRLLLSVMTINVMLLSACQTIPSTIGSDKQATTTVTQTTVVTQSTSTQSNDSNVGYNEDYTSEDDDFPIEPYIPPTSVSEPITTLPEPVFEDDYDNDSIIVVPDPIVEEPPTRDSAAISQQPALPSHSDLLERARQNSQQQNQKSTSNRSTLPAFRNLMQVGTTQLQAGNLTAAENTFTRAQRLAPRSSAVYFYLSQVALKKNQPRKAEAMARRGLSVSKDTSRRRALWQIILRSGQAQNNTRVIREAQQALQ